MYTVYKIGVGLFSNYPIIKLKTFDSKSDAEDFATQMDRENRKEYPNVVDRKFYSNYRFVVAENQARLEQICRKLCRHCF